MEISPDTVLRRVKEGDGVSAGAELKVVGVDDWAWRKGQRYGTILVDLERRVPIDLLADRSAGSLETWLKAHPGVQVISRDRAGVYAEGAAKGAPEAIQVADRFHLLCNLTAAVERSLESRREPLRSAVQAHNQESDSARAEALTAKPDPKTRYEQQKEVRRQRRLDRYNQVVELHRRGMSQNDISRTLDLERKTVRRFLRAGQFPERAHARRRPARVSAFQEYLKQRWNEGCHNATQLWHEIESQGYRGGRSMVARLVSAFRIRAPQPPFRAKPQPRDLSPRQAAMLMAKHPERLTEDQQGLLTKLTATSPEIATMNTLIKDFSVLLREHRIKDFRAWSADTIASGFPELKRFCDGLERDRAAVLAAIELPWSNGQVEGQVHRLKLIKRQMYGRAGFPLLRSRVLPFCAHPAVYERSP
jgi:transposase